MRAAERAGGYTMLVAEKKPFTVMVGEYTALAFVLPVATFVGYALGYLLDKALHTHWIYIPGLLFGIVAGFVQLIRQITRDTGNDGT